MKKALASRAGITLMELIVATALIGIGFLVSVAAYKGITKSVQYSKARTLASNIAQEKMQIIMQKSYYEVVVTTGTSINTTVTPNLPYDTGYFPPETIIEGGIQFTRITYIEVVQDNSGTLQVLPPYTPDTGMRQITVSAIWATESSGNRSLSIKSVLNNPNTVMANSIFKGVVRNAVTLAGISGALVNAAENIGWRDTADSVGNFGISLAPGSFNFLASAAGYFPAIVNASIAPNATVTTNFNLVPMSSGTVTGSAWMNGHVVVSGVVASTGPAGGVEYIELYNPSNIPQDMGSAGVARTNLYVFDYLNATLPTSGGVPVALTYVSTYVPSNRYYLIANTTTVTVAGVTRQADAYYTSVAYPTHLIPQNEAGGLGITTLAGTAIDSISWSKTSTSHTCPTTPRETTCISTNNGLQIGETFVRHTDTTTVIASGYGKAYDSDRNSVDFNYQSITSAVGNVAAGAFVPLTGTPAAGAIISVTDGLSIPSTATLTGSPPYALFTVPRVATGTWIVFVDSGSFSAEISTVAVTANSTVRIPNATTVPTWLVAGGYDTIMTSGTATGMISGKVTDALNVVIAGGIPVTANNTITTTGSNGNYFLRLPLGVYDLTANPVNNVASNLTYASQTQPNVTVALGDVTQNINFYLPRGGRISGWISRDGLNPLPGITVVALDSNGGARDTQVSANNGQFTLINLTTGTYTVKPILDPKEASSPTTSTVTVTAGNTVWSSTFTVSGAMGYVTGTVKLSGQIIKTGVLVVVSTAAIATPLPALSTSTLTSTVYYTDTSNESGVYRVDVRGSTSTVYNVAAFFPTLNNQTPSISTGVVTNVSIISGQTTSGVNFSW